jgi:hypothetical protein
MRHLKLCAEFNGRIKSHLSLNKHLFQLPAEARLDWQRKPEGPAWEALLESQVPVLAEVRNSDMAPALSSLVAVWLRSG